MAKQWRTMIIVEHSGTEKEAEGAGGKLVDYARKNGFEVFSAQTTELADPKTIIHPTAPEEDASGAEE